MIKYIHVQNILYFSVALFEARHMFIVARNTKSIYWNQNIESHEGQTCHLWLDKPVIAQRGVQTIVYEHNLAFRCHRDEVALILSMCGMRVGRSPRVQWYRNECTL